MKKINYVYGAAFVALMAGIALVDYTTKSMEEETAAFYAEELPHPLPPANEEILYKYEEKDLDAPQATIEDLMENEPPLGVPSAFTMIGDGVTPVKAVREVDMFGLPVEESRPKPVLLDSFDMTVTYQTGGMIVPEEEYEKYINEYGEEENVRKVTMIKAPVAYRVIKNQADFNKFLASARGKYPKVDFAKNDFLILESKSELADYIFQIDKIEKADGKLRVDFRVNIFGLEKRAESHAYAIIDKNANVELRQVL